MSLTLHKHSLGIRRGYVIAFFGCMYIFLPMLVCNRKSACMFQEDLIKSLLSRPFKIPIPNYTGLIACYIIIDGGGCKAYIL